MNVCTTHFRRSHSFIDNSPVQPSRASRYRLDSRPSFDAGEPNEPSTHDFAHPEDSQPQRQQPQHMLRRKKAYDALQKAAPQQSQPGTAGHRRNSSLDKLLKKVQGMLKHKASTASFASVLVKATSKDTTSSLPAPLRHKKDLLNMRFEFEQSDSRDVQAPDCVERIELQERETDEAEIGDHESAWVTDEESVADVRIA
ncbi:hypothetical protein LTR85_000275 [Meristemomyces frigidus]|nr:hypothetical protein LTR85_000275 [Meristemomyces frigidus]